MEMEKVKSLFLVEDKRDESSKSYRPSEAMSINGLGFIIAILVMIFDVPEAEAAAVVMAIWNVINMILRWRSRGGEVKAKGDS